MTGNRQSGIYTEGLLMEIAIRLQYRKTLIKQKKINSMI